MTIKEFQPKCNKCGKHGLLDKGLCAKCFYLKNGVWSSKFSNEGKDKSKKGYKK